MTWSYETLDARDRYNTLYGLTQGLSLAVGIASVSMAFGLSMGTTLAIVWGSSILSGLAWRCSWRKYQAAYSADLDAQVEAAKVAYRRMEGQ